MFCRFPLFEVGNAARFGQRTGTGILHGHAEPLELARVKFNSWSSQDLVQNLKAMEVADGEAVGFGDPVQMVGGDNTSCSRHILHNDRRITGDMFAHVARNGSGIGIEPAPGGKTYDDTDRLTFKGGLRRVENVMKRHSDTAAAIMKWTLRFISTLLCHRVKC